MCLFVCVLAGLESMPPSSRMIKKQAVSESVNIWDQLSKGFLSSKSFRCPSVQETQDRFHFDIRASFFFSIKKSSFAFVLCCAQLSSCKQSMGRSSGIDPLFLFSPSFCFDLYAASHPWPLIERLFFSPDLVCCPCPDPGGMSLGFAEGQEEGG